MLARHVSTETDPGARGSEFGRRHAASVHGTIAAYERLFEELHALKPGEIRAIGRRAGDALDALHPDIVDEILGIAAGAEADEESLLALNARTEIFAGAGPPECSAIGVLPQRSAGATTLAQNWDWHPGVADSRILWTVIEPDGHRFTTLTEAGIVAKIGVNDHGLGLCLNILASSRDGGVGGIPIHVLCRLILQRATGLNDALAILQSADATASSCFNVAHAGSKGSDMVSFELSPLGVRAIEPEQGVLLHTNHFLGRLDGAEDLDLRDWPDTVLRLRELEARVRNGPPRLDADFVKSALRSHDAGRIAVCCHDEDNPRYADRQATLASVYLRLDDAEMEITDGAPCVAAYRVVEETRAEAPA